MTSLAAWTGVDPRGPASFYFVSDSRVSWSADRSRDFGRKVFAAKRHPDMFAYFGEVLFPIIAIWQLLELIDSGLYDPQDPPELRHSKCTRLIRELHGRSERPVDSNFTVFHCMREGRSIQSRFRLWRLSYRHITHVWTDTPVEITADKSNLVLAEGTGSRAIRTHVDQWQRTAVSGTSRAIYSAFCDALRNRRDKRSGGSPQLVGLYRDGPARQFGIVFNGQRYFCGSPVPDGTDLTDTEWRDEQFQRLDGSTLTLIPGAARQPRPKGI